MAPTRGFSDAEGLQSLGSVVSVLREAAMHATWTPPKACINPAGQRQRENRSVLYSKATEPRTPPKFLRQKDCSLTMLGALS